MEEAISCRVYIYIATSCPAGTINKCYSCKNYCMHGISIAATYAHASPIYIYSAHMRIRDLAKFLHIYMYLACSCKKVPARINFLQDFLFLAVVPVYILSYIDILNFM